MEPIEPVDVPRFDQEQVRRDEVGLRSLEKTARKEVGITLDALAVMSGRPLSAKSKLAQAERGEKGRHLPLSILAPLLQYPASARLLAEWFAQRVGLGVTDRAEPAGEVTVHALRLPAGGRAEIRLPSEPSKAQIETIWKQLAALRTLLEAQADASSPEDGE